MFRKKIKILNEKYDLFYNSSGNVEAFKLGVKHLSFAKNLGYGKIDLNNNFKVLREFYLIDFENEKILEIKKDEIIKLNLLISYSD